MSWITIRVAETHGSVPRDAGTTMRVSSETQEGTIGGGALEWEATRHARAMLREGRGQDRRTFPLGPSLGQCCGGSVMLDFKAGDVGETATKTPIWIWGAGHVGRAITGTLTPFRDRHIYLVDTAAGRLPDPPIEGATQLLAADPTRAVPQAVQDAHHLIMTYSHDIDLALCDALLRHGFASAGLIGSDTKWARFRKRLREMGHKDADIARIICPIGARELGKHPQAIAIGVVAGIIRSGAITHMEAER